MSSNNRSNKNNILEGNLWKGLVLFALPIALSSLLQQLFNAADQAVVGRFAGGVALAAVGANTTVVSLFVNVFSSCSIGANALIARKIGEGNLKVINGIVHTAMTFALVCGIALSLLCQLLAGPLLSLIGTPADVLPGAVLYLRIYAFGFPFALLYNFGAAILRSTGDTKRPMIALIIAGVINVILNLILVVGFKMSVAGVAIATTISNLVSCFAVIWFLYREQGELQLRVSRFHINKNNLLQILQIGAPASLQSGVFSVANVCIQSGINSLGSAVVAGVSVVSNFEHISYFITNSFCQAATTYCGQNYGANQKKRCRQVMYIAIAEAFLFGAIFDWTIILCRYSLISIFTTETAVVEAAVAKMLVIMILHYTICFYEVPCAALRSVGKSLGPALLTIVGCVAFRVCWLFTVFKAFPNLKALMAVYPASWAFTTVLVWIYYLKVRKQVFG